MKKFLLKTTLFLIILLSLYIAVSFLDTSNAKNDYMASIVDKHQRADSIHGTKIIFSGGSNLAFGLDSQRIQNEFNKPVVNLGLHAGLGLNFILEELKQTAKSGDVVFLSIEYLLKLDGDYKLKKLTSNFYPASKAYYPNQWEQDLKIHLSDTRKKMKSFVKGIRQVEKQKTELHSVYSKQAFNQFGDVVAHLERIPPQEISDRGVLTYRYWEGIAELNRFQNYAQSKNIKVYFLCPNYPVSEYNKNKLVIEKVYSDIVNDLKMPVLNQPSDLIFEDQYFFDTVYHLNKLGRTLRTEKIIGLVKEKKVL